MTCLGDDIVCVVCVISAGLGEGYDVRGRVCVSVGRAEFVLRV